MKLSDIQLTYEYNCWANRLILSKTAELSHEELMQATKFPWGSLHGTLVHLLDAENLWRRICQTGIVPPARLTETEPFPTLESIAVYWQGEETAMWAYLNGLDDDDLDGIIRYQTSEGLRERVLWQCLWHMINHGMQHRSEAAAMLTDFGHSPGGIDFTLFLNLRAGIE